MGDLIIVRDPHKTGGYGNPPYNYVPGLYILYLPVRIEKNGSFVPLEFQFSIVS
jgi:hypothetical protein